MIKLIFCAVNILQVYIYNFYINTKDINTKNVNILNYNIIYYRYITKFLDNILTHNNYINAYLYELYVLPLYHHLVLVKYVNATEK